MKTSIQDTTIDGKKSAMNEQQSWPKQAIKPARTNGEEAAQ